jgi:hypothetical protein
MDQTILDEDQAGLQYMTEAVNADANCQNIRAETLAQIEKLGSPTYASLLFNAIKTNGDKVCSAYEFIKYAPKDDPIHVRWEKEMEVLQLKYIRESIPLIDKDKVATVIAYLSKDGIEIEESTFATLRKFVLDSAELFECDLCGDKRPSQNFVPQEIVLVRTSGHRDFRVCSKCEPEARMNGYFEPLNEDDQCIDCDNKNCPNK